MVVSETLLCVEHHRPIGIEWMKGTTLPNHLNTTSRATTVGDRIMRLRLVTSTQLTQATPKIAIWYPYVFTV